MYYKDSPDSRAVLGVGLLACWECGFESRQWHGCLSLVKVVRCWADPSSRAALPSVACLTVCDLENLNNKVAYAWERILQHLKK